MNMLLSRHKSDADTVSRTGVHLVTGEGSNDCHTYLLAISLGNQTLVQDWGQRDRVCDSRIGLWKSFREKKTNIKTRRDLRDHLIQVPLKR